MAEGGPRPVASRASRVFQERSRDGFEVLRVRALTTGARLVDTRSHALYVPPHVAVALHRVGGLLGAAGGGGSVRGGRAAVPPDAAGSRLRILRHVAVRAHVHHRARLRGRVELRLAARLRPQARMVRLRRPSTLLRSRLRRSAQHAVAVDRGLPGSLRGRLTELSRVEVGVGRRGGRAGGARVRRVPRRHACRGRVCRRAERASPAPRVLRLHARDARLGRRVRGRAARHRRRRDVLRGPVSLWARAQAPDRNLGARAGQGAVSTRMRRR